MVTALQKFSTSLYQDMLSFVTMVKTSNLYYLQRIFPITRLPLFDKFWTNTIGITDALRSIICKKGSSDGIRDGKHTRNEIYAMGIPWFLKCM